MRKMITPILLIACSIAFAQNDTTLPRIDKDTLFTTSGFRIVKGQDIKIGTGSTPDGDFKYIRINSGSLFAYSSNNGHNGAANQANAFSRSQSGLKYKIKTVEARGNKKHGYVYYAKIGSGMINYEIDVENAIETGEIVVPDEYKPKKVVAQSSVVIKQDLSVADEINKLKKLLDDGVITKDEFDAQKKKLLEKN